MSGRLRVPPSPWGVYYSRRDGDQPSVPSTRGAHPIFYRMAVRHPCAPANPLRPNSLCAPFPFAPLEPQWVRVHFIISAVTPPGLAPAIPHGHLIICGLGFISALPPTSLPRPHSCAQPLPEDHALDFSDWAGAHEVHPGPCVEWIDIGSRRLSPDTRSVISAPPH